MTGKRVRFLDEEENNLKKKKRKKSSQEREADRLAKMYNCDYEVSEIRGEKIKQGKRFFLVHWSGYGSDDDTWEVEDNVHCVDLIEVYREKRRAKARAGSAQKKDEKKSEEECREGTSHQVGQSHHQSTPSVPPEAPSAPKQTEAPAAPPASEIDTKEERAAPLCGYSIGLKGKILSLVSVRGSEGFAVEFPALEVVQLISKAAVQKYDPEGYLRWLDSQIDRLSTR